MYQTGNYTRPKIIETYGCPIRKTMRHKEIWKSFLLQQTQQLTNSPDWGHIIHIAVNSINPCIFSRTQCLQTSSCICQKMQSSILATIIAGPGPGSWHILVPTPRLHRETFYLRIAWWLKASQRESKTLLSCLISGNTVALQTQTFISFFFQTKHKLQ